MLELLEPGTVFQKGKTHQTQCFVATCHRDWMGVDTILHDAHRHRILVQTQGHHVYRTNPICSDGPFPSLSISFHLSHSGNITIYSNLLQDTKSSSCSNVLSTGAGSQRPLVSITNKSSAVASECMAVKPPTMAYFK